jgi:protein subunit release factor B
MINFGVSDHKTQQLYKKMADLGISESDINESFIHSGGKGGQNVNKVATCVRLKHVPTGTDVRCQQSREQLLNRYYARKLLVEKIETAVLGKQSEALKKVEKIRRQKRKRSRRAKAKLVADNRHHGAKKAGRKSPGVEE